MILASNLKNRGVIIDPIEFDPKEQVSVDLAIGNVYQVSGDVAWKEVKTGIKIDSGTCIIVQTKEKIKMPNNVFGLLSTKGSIGGKGLLIANTKIDPLFEGKPNIPLFNAGSKKIYLTSGQKICSVSFWKTEQAVVGNTTRNPIKIEPRKGSWLKDFWSSYAPHIITGFVSFISAVISTVAIAIITFGGGQ